MARNYSSPRLIIALFLGNGEILHENNEHIKKRDYTN